MTGTNVLNIGNVGAGTGLQTTAAAQSKKNVVEEAAAVFASLMNQSFTQSGAGQQAVSAAGISKADAFDRYQYQDNQVERAAVTTVSDKLESAGEELKEFADEAVETVSEALGTDRETVEKALEELGMTAFDLLNPQNLAVLTQELTGAEDPAELLLNTDFEELLGQIDALGETLMEQLGLDKGQMDELIRQMDAAQLSPAEPAVTTAEGPAEAQAERMASAADEEAFAAQAAEVRSKEEETGEPAQRTNGSQERVTDGEPQEEPQIVVSDERTGAARTKDQTSGGSDMGQQTAGGNAAAATEQTQQIQAPEAQETVSYSSIDALDLIEQIAENVKVVLANDTTSMEMQLNPESLGKIYLNVSMKEGAVNAQIAAQNEAVKAALEVQVATLRENLNQAGVKVDAIEVTVASHEFERNLEQNEQREKQQEEAAAAQSARRNLRLDSLDELSGLMTEEEALVAQMMKDNGNSVDLTA